jgi:hypothetical protein
VPRRKLSAIKWIRRTIDQRENARAMLALERIGRLEPFEQCAEGGAPGEGVHRVDSLAERRHIADAPLVRMLDMTDHDSDPPDRQRSPHAASPYPLSRMSAPHDLLDVAREIQQADSVLAAVTGAQLETIARQIRALQREAARVLEATRRDAELHRALCRFKKLPGHVYHLYRRPNGELYFSMLSCADWKDAPPHAYEGSYRLEADMRWTPEAAIDARERSICDVTVPAIT